MGRPKKDHGRKGSAHAEGCRIVQHRHTTTAEARELRRYVKRRKKMEIVDVSFHDDHLTLGERYLVIAADGNEYIAWFDASGRPACRERGA